MEQSKYSNPVMESTKDIRARGLVYCNNKLTELHFANAQAKRKADGTFALCNPQRARKDGVIAHLAARSAYNVFVNNQKTGAWNKQRLIHYWLDK
jgi:phage terminase large subunit-like protein